MTPPNVTAQHAQEQLQAAEWRQGCDWRAERPSHWRDVGNALAGHRENPPRNKDRNRDRSATGAREVRCWNCERSGHVKRNCPTLGANDRDGAGEAGVAMIVYTTPAPSSDEVGQALRATHTPLADKPTSDTIDEWIMNSRASHHMAGDATRLNSTCPCPPVSIPLAERLVCVATVTGTASMTLASASGTTPLTLTRVLVVPGLASSHFSVREESRSSFHTEVPSTHAVVMMGKTVVVRAEMRDQLYVLRVLLQSGRALTTSK